MKEKPAENPAKNKEKKQRIVVSEAQMGKNVVFVTAKGEISCQAEIIAQNSPILAKEMKARNNNDDEITIDLQADEQCSLDALQLLLDLLHCDAKDRTVELICYGPKFPVTAIRQAGKLAVNWKMDRITEMLVQFLHRMVHFASDNREETRGQLELACSILFEAADCLVAWNRLRDMDYLVQYLRWKNRDNVAAARWQVFFWNTISQGYRVSYSLAKLAQWPEEARKSLHMDVASMLLPVQPTV